MLLCAGTEDGVVAAWDLRQAPRPLWERQLAPDYVGGLALLPGRAPAGAVVAAADGRLSLLDLRKGGEVVAAAVPSGQPLRCCTTDGHTALAGDEGGALHLWDVAALLGEAAPRPLGAWTPPAPSGLFAPLAGDPPSAANALAVAPLPAGQPGVVVATAHEGGLLRTYVAPGGG